jgi:hypothetical protein
LQNSQLSALPYCVLLVITIASAPVADRLISNKTLTIGATRKVFNLIGTLIPAATLFALGFADGSQKDLTLALLVLAVASTGLIYSGSQVNLIDLAPNHAGTLLGIANGSSTVCSILGPLSVQFFGSDKVKKIDIFPTISQRDRSRQIQSYGGKCFGWLQGYTFVVVSFLGFSLRGKYSGGTTPRRLTRKTKRRKKKIVNVEIIIANKDLELFVITIFFVHYQLFINNTWKNKGNYGKFELSDKSIE